MATQQDVLWVGGGNANVLSPLIQYYPDLELYKDIMTSWQTPPHGDTATCHPLHTHTPTHPPPPDTCCPLYPSSMLKNQIPSPQVGVVGGTGVGDG